MNLAHLQANWKSTFSGILTATLFTTAALLAYPPVLAHPRTVAILGGIQIVAKIWVSLITQDAGTTVAIVPGTPIPQAVPSHEVPDQPAAKAVLPEVKP